MTRWLVSAIGLFVLANLARSEECLTGWHFGFRSSAVFGSESYYVHDDGGGRALYTSPSLRWRSGLPEWYDVGDICCGPYSFVTHDDGTGPTLFCGGSLLGGNGQFFYHVVRWDGEAWTQVGNGLAESGDVRALAVFDDGSGPALYAGTERRVSRLFDTVLWKWDGVTWSPVAEMSGFSVSVFALHVWDDGRGPALYAAGSFASVNGMPAHNIARFDGTAWEPLSAGPSDVSGGAVVCMTEFDDDGEGPLPPALFVGGGFSFAGGVEPHGIARWDGQAWSEVGPNHGLDDGVLALQVFDEDGDGPRPPALFAAGGFIAGGGSLVRIARWDGGAWTPLHPNGIRHRLNTDENYQNVFVRALAVFDDGDGEKLYIGGDFSIAGDAAAKNFAVWDGQRFRGFGGGQGLSAQSLGVRTIDDGTGPAAYVWGPFGTAGNQVAPNGLACWKGVYWTAPPPLGPRDEVRAAIQYFDDSGPHLMIGGQELLSGGDVRQRAVLKVYDAGARQWEHIDVFDAWTSAACMLCNGDRGAGVDAALYFDDGGGPAWYLAGHWPGVLGLPGTANIVRWDGQVWSSVGGGIDGTPQDRIAVKQLIVYDSGEGPELVAAGKFQTAGGVSVLNIARWNGTRWAPLGGGVGIFDSVRPWISTTVVFDSGDGPELVVGGRIDRADGLTQIDGQWIHGIARWNGQRWRSVGGGLSAENCGLSNARPGAAETLLVHDAGEGPALYAGGGFACSGATPLRSLARWDGQTWSSVGGGVNNFVYGLAAFDDARGGALFLAGPFTSANAQAADSNQRVPSAGFARYGCLDTAIPGDLDCDGVVSFFDIEPFIAAILDPAAYESTSPNCRIANGDLNADGQVNFFDIDPFVECLFGVCP